MAITSSKTTTVSTVAELGEHALIVHIRSLLTMPDWVYVGPGDDAAILEQERRTLEVLTTDAFVEHVHFDRRFCPMDAIGHKALAINLSDLAAMGAKPRAALLSLVLPGELTISDLDNLLNGLLSLANRSKIAIVGGNVSRSPAPRQTSEHGPLIIDVTATGNVSRRRVLTRSGARPGDEIYVTGSIGGSVVGLHSLQARLGNSKKSRFETCHTRYLWPEPRVRIGLLLGRNRIASACTDISDGLGNAVKQLSEASRVGMMLDAQCLPIEQIVHDWHAEQGTDAISKTLSQGDDYELLFTMPPKYRKRLLAINGLIGNIAITKIGVVTKKHEVFIQTSEGNLDLPHGFEHFR